MSAANLKRDEASDGVGQSAPIGQYARQLVLLGGILLVATALRLFHLGQSSLWFDEVVTMRLARTQSPAVLLRLLPQIDATRAPLHPLVLQAWVSIFGPSDDSGRALSCLCGVATVALVYWIGLRAFDVTTALWASWLCAVAALDLLFAGGAHVRVAGHGDVPGLGSCVFAWQHAEGSLACGVFAVCDRASFTRIRSDCSWRPRSGSPRFSFVGHSRCLGRHGY